MRTPENTFPRPRAWKAGTSPSRRRPQARFPTRSSIRKKPCTLIVPLSRSPTTGPATLPATYRPIEAEVFHAGDTWWNGHYPFIDYSTGGNIKGMIKAAEANLARVTEKTIVIPGHGKIGGKPEMTEYRDMLTNIHDRVAALKKEGKSLDEIIAAKQ